MEDMELLRDYALKQSDPAFGALVDRHVALVYSAATTFGERPQQISSYAMNGAVIGYYFSVYPPVRLSAMQPTDCAFWETDEKHPEYFNDGANFPGEGVSSRHQNGGIQGAFDGSISYIRLTDWYLDVAATNKNRLWCYPGTADGGGPSGHNN